MRALALALLLATPATAGDPAAVPVTPQLERLLQAGPDEALDMITALMQRIDRADGIVLATLSADRDTARERRIARAVDSLVTLDKSGDGVLTRLEVAQQRSDWSASHLETFFAEFDTDKTGRVDRDEIETGVRLRAEEVGSTALLEDLAGWDLDEDGIVTPAEVEAVLRAQPVGTEG
ncbi:hypothetical protein [Jannaschia seohaensis]|uniref:EF hand n=1 Tax=Jannaschia seohaensis TaxID=475081 RepID=A0A2Y9B6D0_9RHOB|nr:hypothetical protein [Jannaschia seohaensis]PWJ09850.1 EF hand domain-containing protein [Jannaschia seohaensis]SSA51931.1 EF hand [Jannaschia seohaensis]